MANVEIPETCECVYGEHCRYCYSWTPTYWVSVVGSDGYLAVCANCTSHVGQYEPVLIEEENDG